LKKMVIYAIIMHLRGDKYAKRKKIIK